MHLVYIIAITLFLAPVVLLTTGWLRVGLGVIFLLLFPGYTLTAAIFPRKDSLDVMERVALSFGLSMAVVPLIGLILNYTPFGIGLYSITASVALFVLVASTIAIWQRRRLTRDERFHIFFDIQLPMWNQLSRLERTLSIVLVLSIIVATGALMYVVAFPKLGEEFTEFYMPTGRDYPRELTLGEPLMVTLRIVNHHHEDASYYVEVRVDGEVVQQTEPLRLAHDETRDETATIAFAEAGPQRELEFLLYKDDGTDPHRSLYLWISVAQVEP